MGYVTTLRVACILKPLKSGSSRAQGEGASGALAKTPLLKAPKPRNPTSALIPHGSQEEVWGVPKKDPNEGSGLSGQAYMGPALSCCPLFLWGRGGGGVLLPDKGV